MIIELTDGEKAEMRVLAERKIGQCKWILETKKGKVDQPEKLEATIKNLQGIVQKLNKQKEEGKTE